MKTASVIALALGLIGGTNGCAYTSFKNLNARALTTPIEPASARMAAQFCFERGVEYSRRERAHRSQGDSALVGGLAAIGAAAATAYAASEVDGDGTEQALKITSASSAILGAIGLLAAAYLGQFRTDDAAKAAKAAGAAGLLTLTLAERLRAARTALDVADAEQGAARLRLNEARKDSKDFAECVADKKCSTPSLQATAVDAELASATAEAERARQERNRRETDVQRLRSRLGSASIACFDESKGAAAPLPPGELTTNEAAGEPAARVTLAAQEQPDSAQAATAKQATRQQDAAKEQADRQAAAAAPATANAKASGNSATQPPVTPTVPPTSAPPYVTQGSGK